MSRLSVRLRVVIASTLAMAVVLAGLAGFLRTQVERGLDATLDRALAGRIADVTGPLRAGQSATTAVPAAEADEDAVAVQVVDRSGRVHASSAGLGRAPLLDGARLAEAADDDVTVDRQPVVLRDGDDTDEFEARLRAQPVDDDRRDLPIVVAAVSLEDRDATLRSFDTALLVGLPIAIVLSALLGYGLAAGALRPVEAMRRRAAAIDAPSDERLPVPGSRDEIARLGHTLNAMLDRQAEGFRRERAFAADASHELRTPLTILRTELDLAARGERDADELRAALASASDETRRLERLAADLLALARADAATPPSDRRPVDLPALLEAVRDRYAGLFADAGRALSVRPGGPETVEADPDDLARALGGLVENALRHGAGETELEATATADGRVALHVLDRGPGIPEDLRKRVFGRFVTGVGDRRERRGTGLGLPIVAAIATAHGGRAGIDPRLGGGTDAWLSVSSSSHPVGRSVSPDDESA